ncbi:MAG: hypothetical protein Q9187_006139 [Circinaria calcarea]
MVFPTPPLYWGNEYGCLSYDNLLVQRHRMFKIACNALASTFKPVTCYDHSQVPEWNNRDLILSDLIADTTADTFPPPSRYKFMVTSSIIQHTAARPVPQDAKNAIKDAPIAAEEDRSVVRPGRTGRHFALKGYWDIEGDGMWSYEWDAGPEKGFEVLIVLYYSCYQD